MEKKGTGAEHVSYRHNVFRNKMLGFEKILFIIMVSVNILYIIVSFADKNLPAIMTEDIIRLISVTAVQIISCCSFRIINFRDNFSNETKNRMCCISLVGLFAAEELLFYFCEPLWVGTAVVMVISSFFNDRKTIFVIYATSIAVWIASAFMYNYSASSAVKALDVRDFAATFLLISCVFAISVILYNFNKLQVEDVVEYYDGEKKLQEKLSTDYLTQLHTRFSIYENIKQAMHDYYFSGNVPFILSFITPPHFSARAVWYQRRVAVLQRLGVSAPHRHARISPAINIVRSPNHASVSDCSRRPCRYRKILRSALSRPSRYYERQTSNRYCFSDFLLTRPQKIV